MLEPYFTYVTLLIAVVCGCLTALAGWRVRRRLRRFEPLDGGRSEEEVLLTLAPTWAMELGPDRLRAEVETCSTLLASHEFGLERLGLAASASPTLLYLMATADHPAVRWAVASRSAFLSHSPLCRLLIADTDPAVRNAAIKVGLNWMDVLPSWRRIFTRLTFVDAFSAFFGALAVAAYSGTSAPWIARGTIKEEFTAGEPIAKELGLRTRRP